MTKKVKVLIAIGGTGGHVFPGYNLAKDLINKNYQVELITDKRGFKYIKNFKDMNITILPSKPFNKKFIFLFIFINIFDLFIFKIYHLSDSEKANNHYWYGWLRIVSNLYSSKCVRHKIYNL